MDFFYILTEKNVLMIEGIYVSDKIHVYGCMFYCDIFFTVIFLSALKMQLSTYSQQENQCFK